MKIMYRINCYTPLYVDTKCPDNSYDAKTPGEVLKIVEDCLKPIAGISKIEIFKIGKE